MSRVMEAISTDDSYKLYQAKHLAELLSDLPKAKTQLEINPETFSVVMGILREKLEIDITPIKIAN